MKSKEGKKSFKTIVRMRKDSVIWVSITPLMGIEAARLFANQDSVFFLNRLNSTYFKGGYEFLSEQLNTEVNFQTIQSVLLIQPLFDIANTDKIWHNIDNDNQEHVISSFKPSQLKKEIDEEKKEKLIGKFGNIWNTINLSSDLKMKSQEIMDMNSNNKFEITYSEYMLRNSENFTMNYPDKMDINIFSIDTLSTTISVNSISFNKKKKITFRIPDKYERINF
jgi:hypothetical protein